MSENYVKSQLDKTGKAYHPPQFTIYGDISKVTTSVGMGTFNDSVGAGGNTNKTS